MRPSEVKGWAMGCAPGLLSRSLGSGGSSVRSWTPGFFSVGIRRRHSAKRSPTHSLTNLLPLPHKCVGSTNCVPSSGETRLRVS